MSTSHDPLEQAEWHLPRREMLLSYEFWHLYIWSMTFMFFGFYMMSTFKIYGSTAISDDVFLTLIGSIGVLFNGFSRLLISTMLDYYSFRKVFGTLIIV